MGDDDSGPEDLKDDLDLEYVAVFRLKIQLPNTARACLVFVKKCSSWIAA
ncbi:hypothetical protein JXA31_00020 [Candidatus Bathyarchaeota archaeon]|nr:hypothetical protein [Candidatus Bathyarchaeota archaeon]